ncbi:T7SS effector LXG polymorphic toxin [Enterococcus rivorum]|uniref:T7SS effector LXG polymorphic toxin n=1 Tax=Enterococcus rivorum TaxID=762845 RepID=UPI003631492A
MSINMFLGEVRSQSNSATQMANAYSDGMIHIRSSIDQFLNAPLSGKTYDSAKRYFSTVYPPLANAVTMLCESLTEAHRKFPEEFEAQVASCDVQEDELIEDIQRARNIIIQQSNVLDRLKEPNQFLEQSIMRMQDVVQKLQQKLDKLRAFNAQSSSIFSEVEAAQQLVDQALAEIEGGSSWNASTGTFDLNKMNLKWITPIAAAWETRSKKIKAKVEAYNLANQEVTYTFDDYGNVTGVYVDGIFNREATDIVQEAVRTRNVDLIKGFGAGFLDQLSKNNGQALLDQLFGERFVDPSLLGTKGYENGRFVGNLFGLVQSGAEFRRWTLVSCEWFCRNSNGTRNWRSQLNPCSKCSSSNRFNMGTCWIDCC